MIGRKRTYEEACEDQKSAGKQQQQQQIQEQVFSKHLLQIYYGKYCIHLFSFLLHSH